MRDLGPVPLEWPGPSDGNVFLPPAPGFCAGLEPKVLRWARAQGEESCLDRHPRVPLLGDPRETVRGVIHRASVGESPLAWLKSFLRVQNAPLATTISAW